MIRKAGAAHIVVLLLLARPGAGAAQVLPRDSALELERAQIMLRTIRSELHRHYYDTTFHGVDIDAQLQQAEQRLPAAHSNSQLFAALAQAVFSLDDSHTAFIPPSRATEVHYDFSLEMIGDSCYVVAVVPGSDAAQKGVRPGDRVIAVDRYAPNRREFWKFEYVLRSLAPRVQTTVRLESAGSGAVRDVTIDARAIERRRVSDLTWSNGGRDIWELIREEQNLDRNYDGRFVTMGDRALIWRMPTFLVSDEQVDDAAGRLRGRQALILDLRGNSGGAMSAAERLLGHLFETDVHVADLIERHRVIAETARTRGDAFNGTVIVLVDQASASASEVVARTIQRLRRGVVIGDATAGAVMAAHYYGEQAGGAVTALYAMSITEADLVLDGGERLEHVGVQPDVRVLATSGDLASGRDPVLARALQRLGYAFDPAGAGRMFGPRAWGMW